MKIKKGDTVEVKHDRKGTFIAIAIRDFDTETEQFYPLSVDGEEVPCRNTLCSLKLKEQK